MSIGQFFNAIKVTQLEQMMGSGDVCNKLLRMKTFATSCYTQKGSCIY